MPMSVEFEKTEIPDVLEVKTGRFDDDRGFFTETYSLPTWSAGGFDGVFVQDNLSRSKKGTLRGMHYQLSSHGMGKLVRVVRGGSSSTWPSTFAGVPRPSASGSGERSR